MDYKKMSDKELADEISRMMEYSEDFREEWRELAARLASREGWVSVSKEPTDGLLVSMAIRYDHSLGLPQNADRLRATVVTMRQLHEEVVGKGFYSPDKEESYASRAAQQGGQEGG